MMERYREIQRQKAAGEREEGFTLIELLIVIVVLGILAAVVVFALGGVTGQSAVAACKADAKTVETAIGAFEAENPGTAMNSTNATLLTTATATLQGSPYLKSFPSNSTHYYIGIGENTANGGAADEVDIAPGDSTGNAPGANAAGTGGTWVAFDGESSTTGCNAVS
jgi:prepilin-type N-terminal cleavage/methylation domain-containing protein